MANVDLKVMDNALKDLFSDIDRGVQGGVDFERCMGETMSNCKPDHVGPAPARYQCANKPTLFAVDPPRTTLALNRQVMTLCEHCCRTLRRQLKLRKVTVWPVFYRFPHGPAEAAYRIGGLAGLLAVFGDEE